MAADHWIQKTGVSQNKGGLHRALGVPMGKPIPAGKLAGALHSSNPHLEHMAQFARNVKKPKVRKLFSTTSRKTNPQDHEGGY
jgi:hypothetical protein